MINNCIKSYENLLVYTLLVWNSFWKGHSLTFTLKFVYSEKDKIIWLNLAVFLKFDLLSSKGMKNLLLYTFYCLSIFTRYFFLKFRTSEIKLQVYKNEKQNYFLIYFNALCCILMQIRVRMVCMYNIFD